MPTINVTTAIQVYADPTVSSNPLLQYVNWTSKRLGISVDRPFSRQYIVDPNSTLVVFNGQRSTAIDGTTSFTTTISPLSGSRYRVTTAVGTSPAFRTVRTLVVASVALTVTAQANATIQISTTVAGTFSNLVAGDQVWIPGSSTGDTAGQFDASNEGLWSVLGVAAVSGQAGRLLTLKRLDATEATGVSQAVTPAANTEVQAWTAAGVQPSDTVEFASSLWSEGIRKSFSVDRVAPTWFEFLSTEPLPLDVGILPTSTGLIFYTDVKRFLRVEANQEAAVQLNGDTTQLNRVSPYSTEIPGVLEKWGPTWSCSVVNRTSYSLTLNIIGCD